MKRLDPEIFIYKMVVDNGGAPCVVGELLSLAICKPSIRKSATKGSLIFGFSGKGDDERLIYIALVTEQLKGQEYYQRPEYSDRPDCIYSVVDERPVRKQSAEYHFKTDERPKDVGRHFERAFVLLSKDFRYLGKGGTNAYKRKYPLIRKLIERLTQGHRRYHQPMLRAELLALKNEVWKRPRSVTPNPTDKERRGLCNGESPSASC